MTTPALKNDRTKTDYYLITALVQTVEGINGADKILGIRDLEDPGRMLQAYVEHSMKRFLARKSKSQKYKKNIPPNVVKLMDKKVEDFKVVSKGIKFLDAERTRVRFSMVVAGKAASRMAVLHETDPECGCGAPQVDYSPCGCLLYAADKMGMAVDGFLDEHDTVDTWKEQYMDLPDYKIPGNEVVHLLPSDGHAPLPPVTYPQKPGRPTKARIRSAAEANKSLKKKSKYNKEAQAEGGEADQEIDEEEGEMATAPGV